MKKADLISEFLKLKKLLIKLKDETAFLRQQKKKLVDKPNENSKIEKKQQQSMIFFVSL